MITITSISTGLTSLVFFLCGIYSYYRWKKEDNLLLGCFTVLLLSIGFQQMFFSLGSGPFANNFFASNLSWWIAHIFMFSGLAYFVRFPARIKFPEKEKIILDVVIAYAVIGIIILFLQIPHIVPNLFENNVFNWGVPPLVGAVIGIFTTSISLFSVYVFLSGMRGLKERALKLRSLFLALGLFVYYTGGPLHNFITTPFLNIIACALLILGGLLMTLGVFLPKIFHGKENPGTV